MMLVDVLFCKLSATATATTRSNNKATGSHYLLLQPLPVRSLQLNYSTVVHIFKMKFSLALSLLLAGETASGFVLPSLVQQQQHQQRSNNNINQHALAFVPAQQPSQSRLVLWGILDEIESDSYNLMSSSEETDVPLNDAYEVFLGDLVFSTNDPRVDIMNNFELASDPNFTEWLKNKVKKSSDPDERTALRDLSDMIEDVKTKMEVNRLAEERQAKELEDTEAVRLEQAEAQAEEGRQMSTADVLKRAHAINTRASDETTEIAEKQKWYDTVITPEIRLSYEKVLKQVLPPYKTGETVSSIVYTFYDQFDAQFVKVLNERANNGDEDSSALLEALANEQQKRISAATEVLKSVLALGDPMRMEGSIVRLAREGKIDEAFLLLLEANVTQAKDAGANGPAQLMGES
jgi:hypothetical protein